MVPEAVRSVTGSGADPVPYSHAQQNVQGHARSVDLYPYIITFAIGLSSMLLSWR